MLWLHWLGCSQNCNMLKMFKPSARTAAEFFCHVWVNDELTLNALAVCVCVYSWRLESLKGFAKCHITGGAGQSCISVWACICKNLCTNVHMCCWLTVGGRDAFFLPAHPVRLADSTASWWNKLNSLLPNVNTRWHYANTESENFTKHIFSVHVLDKKSRPKLLYHTAISVLFK